MSVYKVKDRQGNKYLYNDDNVFQICWSWQHNANLANFKTKEEKTPLGTIYSLAPNIDWIYGHFGEKFHSHEQAVESLFRNNSGEAAIRQLTSLRIQTKKFLKIYFEKLEQINNQNAAALRTMDRWVTGVKLVRDLGATIVVVGTSVITMPAAGAAALLAAGSGVKAYGKYTDSGNVGIAGVEFVCEMGVGMLGIGAKALGAAHTVGEKLCIVLFAKMPAEAAKCAVSGDSLSQTAAATLTAGLLAGASEGLSGLLGKIPVPASFKEALTNNKTLKESLDLVRGVGENTVEDIAKDKAKERISGKGTNKAIKFNSLKASHINPGKGVSEEEFVRKYCITRI